MIKQQINAETREVELIEMSPVEEAEFIAAVELNQRVLDAEIAAAEAEALAKESARAKLSALGLTEEEVAALIK
jgi:hypothetical protein